MPSFWPFSGINPLCGVFLLGTELPQRLRAFAILVNMQSTLSVTELTRAIKLALENSFPFTMEVEGEVSNFKPHFSGHAYFTLKDAFAQISAVMWRSRFSQLAHRLENGQKVICQGNISLYEKTGRYQINVTRLRPAGQGDLQARLEALKKKLWEEGLFDEQHKRRLPAYPRRVGLISSPTGAAIRDLISVARRRNPAVELIVRPAQVQGERAAPDLIQALQDLLSWGRCDVIILGRGGGSLEDLWAFNDEQLVRTMFQAPVPIVSAVGHEVDISLSDLVADLRAPTPSAASELVIPPRSEMLGQLVYYQERMTDLIQARLRQERQNLAIYQQHHALRQPQAILAQYQERLKHIKQRLDSALQGQLSQQRNRLDNLRGRLQALDPDQILTRGYVRLEQEQRPIVQAADLNSGPAELIFADAQVPISLIRLDGGDHG